MTPSKRYIHIAGMLLLIILGSGCGSGDLATPSSDSNVLQIDPIFQTFYDYLGGEARFGPAISNSFHEGTATVQYLRTGKMIYDPTADASAKFQMAPLASQMGIVEPASPEPAHPELRYENGHVIYPDFVPLYDHLGAETVGKPVGEIHHNLIRNRYEQFFENLGFYRLEGSQEVRLLDYGVWACGKRCSVGGKGPLNAAPATEGEIDILGQEDVDPMVAPLMDQYGADFTGYPLSPAGTAADGRWEQILENVVVVGEGPILPGEVVLRPLSEALSILPQPARPYSGDPNMYFVPTQGADMGYEVPIQFWEYISQHGGSRMFGAPISHYGELNGAVYHQCFQNLCLSYDPSAIEGARIRPEPLGYAYQYLFGNRQSQPTAIPAVVEPTGVVILEPTPTLAPAITESWVLPTAIPLVPTQTPIAELIPTSAPLNPPTGPASPMREITIQVWERYKVVETQEAQEIGVWLMENGQPISSVAVNLVVMMPDGVEQTFIMPLTDDKGQAAMMLPEIEAQNGTMIPYKACYQALADARVCIVDYFLIWNNP